jgi:UDP-N-acetylglucosamine--N-acetylmuramyl-(pentapeptide) pyrophosphoryl-undecaprenol N-acetylglucosamine transferase
MAVSQGLAQLLTICQIIHVSGHNDAASLRQQREELPEALRQRYRLYPFLHEDMSKALTAADLVVTRAGASVLGELPAVGVPAILIPYTGGHRDQEENAAYMERHGAAVVLHDHSLSAQTLVDAVGGLFNNPERLERLRAGVQALAQPDAARHLGRELIQISVPRGDV